MSNEMIPFDNNQIELIRNMFFKGLSDDDLNVFLHVCKRTGLDPLRRQVYAVKRKEKKPDGSWGEAMSIQTGIDGYRLIAETTGRYAPGREPSYAYDKDGKIVSATAYVKKQTIDGTWHEIAATAFWHEYVQKKSDGAPTRFWLQMGHNQLAKCAEALCLRKAFPGDLSGLYTQEEMQQADVEISDVKESHKKPKEIKQEIARVTTELALQLHEVGKQCDPEYMKTVVAYLGKQGITCFNELPSNMFARVMTGLKKNVEVYNQGKENV